MNSFKIFARVVGFAIFATIAYYFLRYGIRVEDNSQSAVHQILAAVYWCISLLSANAAILCIKE